MGCIEPGFAQASLAACDVEHAAGDEGCSGKKVALLANRLCPTQRQWCCRRRSQPNEVRSFADDVDRDDVADKLGNDRGCREEIVKDLQNSDHLGVRKHASIASSQSSWSSLRLPEQAASKSPSASSPSARSSRIMWSTVPQLPRSTKSMQSLASTLSMKSSKELVNLRTSQMEIEDSELRLSIERERSSQPGPQEILLAGFGPRLRSCGEEAFESRASLGDVGIPPSLSMDEVRKTLRRKILAKWPSFEPYVTRLLAEIEASVHEAGSRSLETDPLFADAFAQEFVLAEKSLGDTSDAGSTVVQTFHPLCISSARTASSEACEWRWLDKENVCNRIRLHLLKAELENHGFDCEVLVKRNHPVLRLVLRVVFFPRGSVR
mmetsp:Transcript_49643/g.91648  ORF Transcript_49643/g.91648 Transcript_49643/m.91648 type:complete len:379 (+) Transcript_49643:79-1215(+)